MHHHVKKRRAPGIVEAEAFREPLLEHRQPVPKDRGEPVLRLAAHPADPVAHIEDLARGAGIFFREIRKIHLREPFGLLPALGKDRLGLGPGGSGEPPESPAEDPEGEDGSLVGVDSVCRSVHGPFCPAAENLQLFESLRCREIPCVHAGEGAGLKIGSQGSRA